MTPAEQIAIAGALLKLQAAGGIRVWIDRLASGKDPLHSVIRIGAPWDRRSTARFVSWEEARRLIND